MFNPKYESDIVVLYTPLIEMLAHKSYQILIYNRYKISDINKFELGIKLNFCDIIIENDYSIKCRISSELATKALYNVLSSIKNDITAYFIEYPEAYYIDEESYVKIYKKHIIGLIEIVSGNLNKFE